MVQVKDIYTENLCSSTKKNCHHNIGYCFVAVISDFPIQSDKIDKKIESDNIIDDNDKNKRRNYKLINIIKNFLIIFNYSLGNQV